MNNVLSGLTWTDCLVYLDDIIVFGSTLQEHDNLLDRVLSWLEQAGLKLNAESVVLDTIVSSFETLLKLRNRYTSSREKKQLYVGVKKVMTIFKD